MQEILLTVRYFERGLSKSLEKVTLFFLLNPVPFNGQNYNLRCLMTKKVHKQKRFSVTNNNLNKKIITKNLVTFKLLKDDMKLRIKNFNITGVH